MKRRILASVGSSVHRQSMDDGEGTLQNTNKDNVFHRLLADAGLKLRSGQIPLLRVDQSVFQKRLSTNLRGNPTLPQVIRDFTKGFNTYVDDIGNLFMCLQPTLTDPNCDSARSSHQDSVVRLLLGLSEVQVPVMTTLLQKLLEFSSDEELLRNQGDLKGLPKTILFQFRWLDTIVDSSLLCEKLLEISSVASSDIHAEIISCIPEILQDKDHEAVAIAWSELLQQKTELTSAILDSLPNLNVSVDVLAEMKSVVLKSLETVEVDLLPVIVKFLLQSASPEDATEILNELRLRLDFFSPGISSQQASVTKTGKQSYEVLTLEVIRTSVQFQKLIGDSLVKVLENSRSEKEPRIIDLFLILVLADMPSRKKHAEMILITKVRNRTITEALVRKAFKNSKEVCHAFFTSILSLSECLFNSNDTKLREFGGFIKLVVFEEMNNPIILQELVASLVSRIRGCRETEVDTALNVLKQMVIADTQKMAPFSVFLKGLLDRLESLKLFSIRRLYEVLSLLGQLLEHDSHGVLDDLHIVVRKQLANSDQGYRKMGVLGALATVRRLGTPNNSSGNYDFATAKSVIGMVEQNVSKDFEAKALFFEELSSAVVLKELHPKLEVWLADHLTNDFQDEFIMDSDENSLPMIPDVEGQLAFALDDIVPDGIALNILKIAHNDEKALETSLVIKRFQLPYIAPQFRLLRLCEQVTHNNSLEGLDALLGCSVYVFSPDLLDRFENLPLLQRKLICRCLFGLINWFIELINAFVTQSDELRTKVALRVCQIVQLRDQLEKCLDATPGFVPPLAHFDLEVCDRELTTTKVKKNLTSKNTVSKQKGVKRKRKAATSDSGQLSSNETSQAGKSDQIPTSPSHNATSVNLSAYAVYFRELDLEAFTVLQCKLNLKHDTENDMADPFGLREFNFLLNDLQMKLHIVFDQSSVKTPFLNKAKFAELNCMHRHIKSLPVIDVAKSVIELLRSFRRHLKTISRYWKLDEANDDDVDCVDQLTSHNLTLKIFCQILDIIFTLYSWKGFKEEENRDLLCKSLLYFAEDRNSVSSQSSITLHTEKAFGYFHRFISIIPNFMVAVSLIKLLNVIFETDPEEQLKSQLVETCDYVLKKKWDVSEENDTTKHSSLLKSLLKIYFNACEDVLEVLEILATKAIPELIQSARRNGHSETYPTLTKSTITVYYEVMHQQLVSYFQWVNIEKEKEDVLHCWKIGVRIFHILVSLIKEFDVQGMILLCLKCGRTFMEVFIKQAMPLLDRLFKSHRDDILSLIKTVQQSTRFLHVICSHSKVLKYVRLTNCVPPLRKLLEAFVLRVKSMLALNRCKEAFWLGNLKNRNLQGEEILSQMSSEGSSISQTDADEDSASSPEEIVDDDNEHDDDADAEQKNFDSGEDEDSGNVSECY